MCVCVCVCVCVLILSLQINAMVNKAQGKGYENESFYSNMKFQFLGIENIHIMRSSLQKLVEGWSSFANSCNFALEGVVYLVVLGFLSFFKPMFNACRSITEPDCFILHKIKTILAPKIFQPFFHTCHFCKCFFISDCTLRMSLMVS